MKNITKDKAQYAVKIMKIFSQYQRLMIIYYLINGELSVSEIGNITGIKQPLLSQQLAKLRIANIIEKRRKSKNIYYRIKNDKKKLCDFIISIFLFNDEK